MYLHAPVDLGDPLAAPDSIGDRIQRALSAGKSYLALGLALLGGVRDENELTNMLFFARHPERRGAKLQRSDPDFGRLSREWLDIRDGTVRPFLESRGKADTSPAPTPTPSGAGAVPSSVTGRWCGPRGGGVAKDRCPPHVRPACPRIEKLLCITAVSGAPFRYVEAYAVDPRTKIFKVTRRQMSRTQRLVPEAADALSQFLADMRQFGMPVSGILTMGSLYCRCIRGTSKLSNHSFGDAIDIAGVKWAPGAPSTLPETLVHNHAVALYYWRKAHKPVATSGPLIDEQTRLVRRMNACLRLSFRTVIDYYSSGHRNHFHCDLRRTAEGRFEPRRRLYPSSRSTWAFVQEALATQLGRPFKRTGRLDEATRSGLMELSGKGGDLFRSPSALDGVLDDLFLAVAKDA